MTQRTCFIISETLLASGRTGLIVMLIWRPARCLRAGRSYSLIWQVERPDKEMIMAEKPTYEELEQRIVLLENESACRKRFEEINRSLFKISDAINMTSSLDELFRTIHLALSPIIDTTNFFIALYDKTNDSITFPYRVDSVDDSYPPFIEVSKTASLAAEVIRTGRPVFVTKTERLTQLSKSSLIRPGCTPSEIWLGVPLKTRDEIIGVMAVQSYHDPLCYDQTDMDVMVSVADQVAVAVKRKKDEELLRNSEERLRILFNGINEAVFVYEGPENGIPGTFIEVNDPACVRLGYSRNELLTMRPFDIEVPESVSIVPKMMEYLYAKGDAIWEGEHVHKDGSRIPVEIGSCLAHLEGRQVIISTVRDITERKRVETEFLENRKRLADIVNFLPDATLAIDKEKRVIIWNKAIEEITGVPAAEMIGKGDYAYTIPFYGEARPQLMDLIFTDQGDVAARYPKITREGECFIAEAFCNALYDNKGAWIFAKASPLHDQSGSIVGAIESIRDITELKQAEVEQEKLQAQLNQAQKMESVGRLAGGVAHDFNNMLQSITGNAEMALDEIDPTHPLHGKLSEILKVARRSADLTRQLLAFARKQTISPIVLDLNETISGMLKMLHRLIGEDIDFSWKPALNLWPVKIDPSQIDQILVNLCVNARDAISGVGSVTIETENVRLDQSHCETHNGFIPGEYVQLAVSDSGMGIEKDMLDLIFEPFFTTKELGKGTGLGLSTVYGIVKQNDGFIYVSSEPGQGTTFRIYLPRTEDIQTKTEPDAAKQRISVGTETVLFVEDDESILDIGKVVLERFGYTVLATHNPNDALALAKNHSGRIHLLITDVIMPEMNGQELRQRLQEIQPELKVIFISGYTANIIAHHGVLDKRTNFLQKPFSVQILVEKVREVLDEDSKPPICLNA